MEEYRAYVVQMAVQGEKASPSLVAPDLDLVVVTSGHEQGLSGVEVDTADRAIVFFKAVDQGAHAIVP